MSGIWKWPPEVYCHCLVVQTVKNLPAVQDPGSIPRSGRSPGDGNGNLLQYSCLENAMVRGDWRATVHGAGNESDTTQQLTHIKVWSTHRPPASLRFYKVCFCFKTEDQKNTHGVHYLRHALAEKSLLN